MSWIEVVGDGAAEGRLAELYARMVDPTYGRVDAIMQVHSLHPEGLRTHHELYAEVMTGTRTLRKVERELIALLVSRINECHYWIVHHRRGLRRLLRDDRLLERIEDRGYRHAGLEPKRVEMLRFVEKLTRTPAAMERADVDRLREAGFSDEDVLHIVEVAAYYAYVNRVADGLGVELESWIPVDEDGPP